MGDQGGDINKWEQSMPELAQGSLSHHHESILPLEEDCVLNLVSGSHFYFSKVVEISEEKRKRGESSPE